MIDSWLPLALAFVPAAASIAVAWILTRQKADAKLVDEMKRQIDALRSEVDSQKAIIQDLRMKLDACEAERTTLTRENIELMRQLVGQVREA